MGTPGRSVESAWVGEEEFEPGQITLTKSWRNELWHERIVLSANRLGRRICAQESIFFVKSLIKCKISEYFHYSKVRKYKMFEQTMCFIPAYDITNKEAKVQVMHSL